MNHFCIVGQGGGMITAYHAGVVSALKKRFGFKKLHRIVASSGAAAVYSYLVSGQENLIQPIWENLVKSRKFVTLWKFPIGKSVMRINFLVDEMIKSRYSLNLSALKNNPIKLEIGVIDAETGGSIFFSKDDSINFYELLRASCAVPYFSEGKVCFGGRCYYDGTIGSVSGLERVFDEDNILIVLVRPPTPLSKMLFFRKILRWLLIRNETIALQEAIWSMPARYEQMPFFIDGMRQKKNIAVIQPMNSLPIFRIDTRFNCLSQTIRQGYNDTMNHQGLEDFFRKIS